jgi:hypothetical protein
MKAIWIGLLCMAGVCFANGDGPREVSVKGEASAKYIVLDFPDEIKDFIDAAAGKAEIAEVPWWKPWQWSGWGIEGLCRSVKEAERQGKKDTESHGKLLAGFVKLLERYNQCECPPKEINILAYYLSKFNAYHIPLPLFVKGKIIRYETLIDPSVYTGEVYCACPSREAIKYQDKLYELRQAE